MMISKFGYSRMDHLLMRPYNAPPPRNFYGDRDVSFSARCYPYVALSHANSAVPFLLLP